VTSDAPAQHPSLKIAFLARPEPYGLYTVFRNLRPALASRHGIELRWLARGSETAKHLEQTQYAADLAWGEVVNVDPAPDAGQGAALVRHLIDHGYHGVIVNPPCWSIELNAMRYVPQPVRRMMVVHSIAPGAYRAAAAIRDNVQATIGISPRVRDDLVARHGFDPSRTHAIANSLDLTPYENVARDAPVANLRLLSFGRIEEFAKGVFWLPQIMRELRQAGVEATLSIAGDGPDLAELRRRCDGAGVSDRINFVGFVEPARIPDLVARHDVFLLTSRMEGFGYTVIEAMCGGCVPVASSLRGVTDFIIEHGRTGMLFQTGDTRAAARCVAELAQDRNKLLAMSEAAKVDCRKRFNSGVMADAYAGVIRAAMERPGQTDPPLPLDQWRYPRALSPAPSLVNRLIPPRLKAWIIGRMTGK
jgi:glycosyltransferase involved in cell wall biosynthesis